MMHKEHHEERYCEDHEDFLSAVGGAEVYQSQGFCVSEVTDEGDPHLVDVVSEADALVGIVARVGWDKFAPFIRPVRTTRPALRALCGRLTVWRGGPGRRARPYRAGDDGAGLRLRHGAARVLVGINARHPGRGPYRDSGPCIVRLAASSSLKTRPFASKRKSKLRIRNAPSPARPPGPGRGGLFTLRPRSRILRASGVGG